MEKERYMPYTSAMRMRELIADNPNLLPALTRFDIALGFGEATVAEVCSSSGVHTDTFLAVVNFLSGFSVDPQKVDVRSMIAYLGNAHSYFLEYVAPKMRVLLLEAISTGESSRLSLALIDFFDSYIAEVRRHTDYEDTVVFSYVNSLLEKGATSEKFSISDFKSSHKPMTSKLAELKDLLVCHFTADKGRVDKMNTLLFDIVTFERDLRRHCELEDALFIPVVSLLESGGPGKPFAACRGPLDGNGDVALTAREREIIACVAAGLSNKEIAARLFLSVYTVATHRRNICAKLNLHSASALAVYAIMHGLADA